MAKGVCGERLYVLLGAWGKKNIKIFRVDRICG